MSTLRFGIEFCELHEINWIDLFGKYAIKQVFDSKIDDRIIMLDGCGHGMDRQHTGHECEVLLDADNPKDLELMKGIGLGPLTCNWGNSAEDWLNAGIPFFSGYIMPFTFTRGSNRQDDEEALSYHLAHFIFMQNFLTEYLRGVFDPKAAHQARYDAFTALANESWNPVNKVYYIYNRDISITEVRGTAGVETFCLLPDYIRKILHCPH